MPSSKSREHLITSFNEINVEITVFFCLFLFFLRRILVTDENDEVPVFTALSGCVSVTEFHDWRQPMATISAQDGDDPHTPNGKITFSIRAGNDHGH